METVEIVVYLIAGLILGVLILGFIVSWDYLGMYEDLKDSLVGEEQHKFREVDTETFVSEILWLWEECGMGETNMSLSLYVTGADPISKEMIFRKIKFLNFCSTLQSAKYKCGIQENMNGFTDITLPNVIRIYCDQTKGNLSIIR